MQNSEFKVQTEQFNGPLDLLLNLIEKRKLLINDISLAKITDDYINHIQNMENVSISNRSHFILTASTLLLIKSKSLLPTLELTQEEEQSIEDLERRLKIYKRIKSIEPKIAEMFGKNRSFFKQQTNYVEVIFTPTKQITTKNILDSIKNVLTQLPKVEKISKVSIKKVISLEETIQNLTERVKNGINMSFKEFSNFDKAEKVNVIVSFLAMLELVKQGMIEVEQKLDYSDIDIQTKEFGTPNYS
jgi:segregation and condensation protein A